MLVNRDFPGFWEATLALMKYHSLLLDAADLCTLIGQLGRDRFMDELIERLETEIRHYDPEVAQVPPRNGVHYRRPEWGLLEAMPAHFGEAGTTVKLVGYHPANPIRSQMPSVVSTIAVFESRTGHLAGVLDGTFLTALRTGAASAVASRVLAAPESGCLGVIGCGAQAVTQVHALTRRFDIAKVIGSSGVSVLVHAPPSSTQSASLLQRSPDPSQLVSSKSMGPISVSVTG